MSKVILFLALVLCLWSTTVFAQSKQSGADAELLEANRLTRDIVKLYGERKLVKAIEVARRVIKIRQNKLGPNDLLVGDSVGNLAMLHLANRDALNAEKASRHSLDIYYRNGAKGEPAAARTLDRLAHTAFVGRITIRAKVFGENSRDIARLRLRLACFKYKNNEHAEAVKIESDANHVLYQETTTVATPVALSEELFDCKLLSRPKPDFGNRRLSGSVVIEVEVDESGNVAAAKMISGEPTFEERTLKAALKAKVMPTFVEGQAVKAKGLVTYSFRAIPPLVVNIDGLIITSP